MFLVSVHLLEVLQEVLSLFKLGNLLNLTTH